MPQPQALTLGQTWEVYLPRCTLVEKNNFPKQNENDITRKREWMLCSKKSVCLLKLVICFREKNIHTWLNIFSLVISKLS